MEGQREMKTMCVCGGGVFVYACLAINIALGKIYNEEAAPPVPKVFHSSEATTYLFLVLVLWGHLLLQGTSWTKSGEEPLLLAQL